MKTALALDYRPLRLAEVVGQAHIKPILKAMVTSGKVPPALLFSGTRGTGKTTTARIFAAALNCLDPQDGDACGSCVQCRAVQRNRSTSVHEVDAASSGGVEEVRKIRTMCLYAHEARWRVIILDEAHSMSKEAYNALLKLLEEPPPNTVFVLVTTEPEKILGTVRSRAMGFEFHRLRPADVISRLQHISDEESLQVQPDLLSEISKTAQGGMRDAVMLLDQVTRVGVTTAEDFRSLFGIKDYALPLMWAAIRGDHAEGYRLLSENFSRTGDAAGMVSDLTRLVSDLLVIKSEGRPQYGEEELAERVEMAGAVTVDRLVKVIEVLWELKSRTRATENDQFSSMEMGFALITDAVRDPNFRKSPEPEQPILPEKPQPSHRLSLAEISEAATGR